MLGKQARDLPLTDGPFAIRQRSEPAERTNNRSWGGSARWLALASADCLAFVAAAVTTLYIPVLFPGSGMPLVRSAPLFHELVVPFGGLLLYHAFRGRYTKRMPFWTEAHRFMATGLFAAGMEAGLAILPGGAAVVRPNAAVAILLASTFAIAANRLAKYTFSTLRVWQLPAVIIGDEAPAGAANVALSSDNSLGYHITGTVAPSALAMRTGRFQLAALLARHKAECLVIALEDPNLRRTIINTALRERVPFAAVFPPGFCCQVTQIPGHDPVLLAHSSGLFRPLPRLAKSAFDIAIGCILLLVASPLLAVIALMVCADGGAVLFRHRRLGADGRHFWCLKFRTMVMDAEQALTDLLAANKSRAAEWRATQKLRDDPRVTRVGRLLRRTSLDELPQLINVIRGEMSLVGPRPIVDSEVAFYGADIAHYYATRPGMTGLWQVSGRSDTSYAQRVQLDMWYVNHWTIWWDITVLLKTIPAVIRRRGAH